MLIFSKASKPFRYRTQQKYIIPLTTVTIYLPKSSFSFVIYQNTYLETLFRKVMLKAPVPPKAEAKSQAYIERSAPPTPSSPDAEVQKVPQLSVASDHWVHPLCSLCRSRPTEFRQTGYEELYDTDMPKVNTPIRPDGQKLAPMISRIMPTLGSSKPSPGA